MIRRPRYLESEPTSRWIISYVDMLTILLILFVSMAAQNLHGVQLHSEPVVSVPAATPGVEAHDAKLNPALVDVQQKLLGQHLNLRIEPHGLVISLPQAILFPSGEDQISPAALPVVSQIAEVLHEIPNKVSLVGHADTVPIHNRRFKSNWELSAARGLKLMELLNHKYGIPESRLSIASYGSYSPMEPNDTEDGRARNRRVEIVILN